MNPDGGVPIYLLHPLVVHFPIALLVLGLLVALAGESARSPAWFPPAAAWMLGVGTLLLWAALGLGLLAERTMPHVPAAWKALASHKERAWMTAWAFTAVCGLQFYGRGRRQAWVHVLWGLALVLLILTAHLGATLVFTYGVGSTQ